MPKIVKKVKYMAFLKNAEASQDEKVIRSVKFFLRHPQSYPIIVDNLYQSLKKISELLVKGGLLNKGKPYSLTTISRLKNCILEVKGTIPDNAPVPVKKINERRYYSTINSRNKYEIYYIGSSAENSWFDLNIRAILDLTNIGINYVPYQIILKKV